MTPPVALRHAACGSCEDLRLSCVRNGRQPVPDAYTPIMKIEFSGIEVRPRNQLRAAKRENVQHVHARGLPVACSTQIDLLQATLALPSVPEDIDLSDINILRNLDDRSVRSLNGPRVADELLRLVPNVETYRKALCAVKLWAQRTVTAIK